MSLFHTRFYIFLFLCSIIINKRGQYIFLSYLTEYSNKIFYHKCQYIDFVVADSVSLISLSHASPHTWLCHALRKTHTSDKVQWSMYTTSMLFPHSIVRGSNLHIWMALDQKLYIKIMFLVLFSNMYTDLDGHYTQNPCCLTIQLKEVQIYNLNWARCCMKIMFLSLSWFGMHMTLFQSTR